MSGVPAGGAATATGAAGYENQQQFLEHQTIAAQRKVLCYIGGLSGDIQSVSELSALCTPFGTVVNVSVPRDVVSGKHRGFCFVEFSSAEDCAACIDNLHGSQLYGRTLTVNYAKPTSIKFSGHTNIDTVSYEQSIQKDSVTVQSAFAEVEQEQQHTAEADNHNNDIVLVH